MIPNLGLRSALVIALLVIGIPGAAQGQAITRDVVYGHKDGMALTFDVVRPATPNGAGVLYIVSSGWNSRYSPPEEVAGRFQELLGRGFTLFVVRHGSSPKYVMPEIVEDVRRATRYIRFNADQWGVDRDRLGAFGASAGGHLSLMLGTVSVPAERAPAEPFLGEEMRLASVVAYYPPTEFRTWPPSATYTADPSERYPALGFDPALRDDLSPLLQVTSDDAPVLVIHGTGDAVVPYDHSVRIHEALVASGVEAEIILLDGVGHGYDGEDAERAAAATAEWFERTLTNRN